jgi:hypothetical protein
MPLYISVIIISKRSGQDEDDSQSSESSHPLDVWMKTINRLNPRAVA